MPRSSRPAPRRVVGAAAVAAATLVIAALTLSPQPAPSGPPIPFWCLVCGTLGGADVLGNILLFMPLGAALAIAGVPFRRAALLAILASGGIELLQLVVPGRTSTASDLLTNTLGALLGSLVGARWRTLLLPDPRAAFPLAVTAALGWNAVTALAAWGLGRDPADGPTPAVHRPGVPIWGSGWFHGRVRRGEIDGFPAAGAADGPVVIQTRTGRAVRLSAEVLRRDDRDQPVAFLAATDGDGVPQATLGQRGDDASLAVRLRASRLRLRRPSLTLPGAFAAVDGTPLRLTGSYADHTLALGADRGGRRWARVIRLAPSMGWMLILPFLRGDDPAAPAYTALWLALLAAPLGFWSARLGASRRRAAVATVAAGMAGALAVVPAVGGYGVASAADWGAGAAGLLAGALLALAAHRVATSFVRPAPRS